MSKRFSKQSDLYARYRPDYPREMYDFIFRHLSARETAWDCATGSGQIANYLADHFDKVLATDISDEQLSYAPKRSNVEYLKASAENSGLAKDQFDLITVGQAIHWFDFDSFYQEVRRVAKNNALLAVIGYGMVRINKQINPLVDELYEKAFSTYFGEARKYLDQHYTTLPFPISEIPSPNFKRALHWSVDELEGYFNSWSAIQKIKTEQDYNPATNTIRKVRKMMGDKNKLEVTFPVFIRLGRIEK